LWAVDPFSSNWPRRTCVVADRRARVPGVSLSCGPHGPGKRCPHTDVEAGGRKRP
jgi:hypothetical protein